MVSEVVIRKVKNVRERGVNYGRDAADKFIGTRRWAGYKERYTVKRTTSYGTTLVEYFSNLPRARAEVKALLQFGTQNVIHRQFHPR